jgi:cytidine deaminase
VDAIAIVGAPLDVGLESEDLEASQEDFDYAYPCGACRQVMAEFLPDSKDIDIIVAKSESDYRVLKLEDMLPYTFELV